MRARNVKPGIFKNEVFGEADPLLTLLFIGLWCMADRDGLLEDRPARIRAEVFPYRDSVDVVGMLKVLESKGFIHRYSTETVNVIQVVNFAKHQHPHVKEKASGLPGPEKAINKQDVAEIPVISGASPVISGASPVISGSSTSDSLIPDSPITDSGLSESGLSDPGSQTPFTAGSPAEPPAEPKKPRAKKKPEDDVPKTAETWAAYSAAYFDRYKVPATRNATVNAQIGMFVNRVPLDQAPRIAEWFVWSNKRIYVERGHTVALMLRDAESLRMEWMRGRGITSTEATLADKTAARGNVFHGLIEEAGDGVEASH